MTGVMTSLTGRTHNGVWPVLDVIVPGKKNAEVYTTTSYRFYMSNALLTVLNS